MKTYSVYILTNPFKSVMYVGVTGNLEGRMSEHKNKLVKGFSSKYNTTLLVYYENYGDVNAGIAREKQIKSYRREKKNKLVEEVNPHWSDLSLGWGIA